MPPLLIGQVSLKKEALMRAKKAKRAEKDFELLAEQAQQARTQFFVYLATSAFLLVTVMSITDKQLLLNNSSITLPLLNIGVPPFFVLIIGPLLLLLTFSNLHIHWFRYVEEVKELGLSTEKARRKLFPILIYQALYHPKEGFVGKLENVLAGFALFGLLVPIQACFLWQISKIQYPLLSSMEYVLFLASIFLTAYWLEKSPYQSLISQLLVAFDKVARAWLLHLERINTFSGYKFSPTFKGLYSKIFSVVPILYSLSLGVLIVTSAHIEVPYEVLSPPLELINTPIVDPFLKRMESKKEVKKAQETQAKQVFEYVYWVDLKDRSLMYADFERTVLLKANLSGVNLNYANLKSANLEQSNLFSANLQHADLTIAKLQDAYLNDVKLQNANLQQANLQNAILDGANLQNANLLGANLQNVNLDGANLQNANLCQTNLQNVYFRRRWDDKTNKNVPVYKVGGETLCDALALRGAKMDDWLFKKLKTLKACKGKLKGVNDPNYF
jgi:uncharacterized protein YjbI with pentapeptide repeats